MSGQVPAKPASVLFSIEITRELADEIARCAAAGGISEKAIVTRALAAFGLSVPEVDLQNETRRRSLFSRRRSAAASPPRGRS
jgi:hypothetical protein